MNKVVLHHNWMKEGKWRLGDSQAASIPLRDRKIGFLGYGAVNRNVHRFLSGFDNEFSSKFSQADDVYKKRTGEDKEDSYQPTLAKNNFSKDEGEDVEWF